MHYTNEHVTLRFEGGIEFSRPWLRKDPARAQRVLRAHASENIRCLCTPLGVPMHVVCRDGKYHLATNPGRGHHHALSCPAYLPSEEDSGFHHYSRSAFSRAGGLIKLSVSPSKPTAPPFPHFSPSAALQFIWHLAGLNVVAFANQ